MWTDDLHAALLRLTALVNRSDFDSAFLSRFNLKLDRALFPLLVRIGRAAPVSVVELADTIGRDHSTVSRQAAKLEALGLIERLPAPDQRMRLMAPTVAGAKLLADIAKARRQVLEKGFAEWGVPDIEKAIAGLEGISDCLSISMAPKDRA